MTTLHLARHGQTSWNNELRYQGQMDIELSTLGRMQAERLALRMSWEPIEAAYSSDLSRCLETANLVCRGLGVVPVASRELREASYGEWEGLTYAEVRARYPAQVAERRGNIVEFAPPGGESLGATRRRVVAALDEIAKRHPNQHVLIVTHGGPLRMLVAGLLDVPSRNAFRLRVDNCGLSRIEGFPHSPMLAVLNETHHLRGLEAPSDPALGN